MTWALSFQKVEQANPAAADLLRLCSFLAADSIPEAILKVTYDTWAQCQRYLPHIEICASLIDHYHLAFAEAADLCHSAGFYLNDVGQYEQAESLYQRALRVDESVFGPDHPEVATDLLEGYARLLRRMKRLEEAAPLEAGAKVIRARHHP
jgi:tetratricopeptide (TPR) repeat protein